MHPDRVILCLDPTFMPKTKSWFQRAQEVILPDFCPNPKDPREHWWHTLNVCRALCIYIARMAPFQKTEMLFISFQPKSLSTKVTPSTIGCWLKACISLAYDHQARPIPGHIMVHSTRSAATTAAWATQASILEICRATIWPSPFIRNYMLNMFASAEVAFGRRVFQQVLPVDRTLDISTSHPRDT